MFLVNGDECALLKKRTREILPQRVQREAGSRSVAGSNSDENLVTRFPARRNGNPPPEISPGNLNNYTLIKVTTKIPFDPPRRRFPAARGIRGREIAAITIFRASGNAPCARNAVESRRIKRASERHEATRHRSPRRNKTDVSLTREHVQPDP